jgi:hypothetical protein
MVCTVIYNRTRRRRKTAYPRLRRGLGLFGRLRRVRLWFVLYIRRRRPKQTTYGGRLCLEIKPKPSLPPYIKSGKNKPKPPYIKSRDRLRRIYKNKIFVWCLRRRRKTQAKKNKPKPSLPPYIISKQTKTALKNKSPAYLRRIRCMVCFCKPGLTPAAPP